MLENILVLGAGKMVEGILRGLKQKVDLSRVTIFSPSGVSAEKLAAKLGAKATRELDSIRPDLILIGCKPQQIKDLKLVIGDRFQDVPGISMLAALPEKLQRDILGLDKIIRVMPNLAVAFNEGVCLVSSSSAPESLPRVREIFELLGHVEIVTETELEELTLLTGSSPAFFYEFAKNLADSFSSLDPSKRELLIRKSLEGAAATLRSSDDELKVLIQNVTSKGGVTIAVLEELRKQNLAATVSSGIKSGHARARDLSSSILQN